MVRKLPWKRGAQAGPDNNSSSTPVASHHIKTETKTPDHDGDIKASSSSASKPKARKSIGRTKRSASTSPPPEPLQEAFMVEGFDEDDRWRMVEDELLATAQRFTAHLHAAEYQRLKEAAKSQNAEAIRNISRPVVGAKTDFVKKKHERLALQKQQRRALKRAAPDETESGDGNEVMPTSLCGLMESPRKQVPRLDGLTSISASTRAAAGFVRSQPGSSQSRLPESQPRNGLLKTAKPPVVSPSDSDDDDDLAASSRRFTARLGTTDKPTVSVHGKPSVQSQRQPKLHQDNRPDSTSVLKKTHAEDSASYMIPRASEQKQKEQKKSTRQSDISLPEMSDDSDLDGDIFSHFKNRRAQRKSLERKRSDGNTGKTRATEKDIIPDF